MSETGAPTGAEPSAGALLREAREAAGLHLDTLAANLKVPPRKLEALEQDRYDLLPDAVFVRALASSVCRTLKIDPQPVLQRLPQTEQPRLAQVREGINAPFKPPHQAHGRGWLGQLTSPVALTVVALLLAAVVLIFLPVAQRSQEAIPVAATPLAAEPPEAGGPPVGAETVAGAPAAGGLPVLQSASELAAGTPPAMAADPAAPAAVAAAQPAPGAGVPASAPQAGVAPSPATSVTPATATAAATPAGLLVFRTSADSWVQVQDASGATVLQRLMTAGDTASASGSPPLSVTVGNAAATEVLVRGQPYNLGRVARDNVARFRVE